MYVWTYVSMHVCESKYWLYDCKSIYEYKYACMHVYVYAFEDISGLRTRWEGKVPYGGIVNKYCFGISMHVYT